VTDLFEYARQLRDTGMARAAAAQDRADPSYRAAVLEAIKSIARRQATVHVNDLYNLGIERPKHHNVMGSIWREAANHRWIAMTDRTAPCIDPLKHRHRSPIYKSLIFGGMEASL
jgi:hypothetical protein